MGKRLAASFTMEPEDSFRVLPPPRVGLLVSITPEASPCLTGLPFPLFNPRASSSSVRLKKLLLFSVPVEFIIIRLKKIVF